MPDVPFAPPPAAGQRALAASPGPPGPQCSGADIRHLSCSSRRAPDEEVRICCGAPRAGSRGRALGDSLVSTKRSPSFSKNGACRELLRMSPTRWPDAQVRSAEGGAEPSPRRSASSPSAPETASQEPPSRPDGAPGEGPGGPGHRVLLKRRFSTSGERDALAPVPLPLGPLGTAAATEPPSRARPPSLHVLPLPGDARPEDSGARGAGGSPRASPPPASRNRPPQGDRPARPPREAGLEPHGVRKCPHPPGREPLPLATAAPRDPGR